MASSLSPSSIGGSYKLSPDAEASPGQSVPVGRRAHRAPCPYRLECALAAPSWQRRALELLVCNKGRALRAHLAGKASSRAMPDWLRGIDRRHDRRCLLPLAAAEEMEHGSEPSGAARPSRDLQERATPSHGLGSGTAARHARAKHSARVRSVQCREVQRAQWTRLGRMQVHTVGARARPGSASPARLSGSSAGSAAAVRACVNMAALTLQWAATTPCCGDDSARARAGRVVPDAL